MYVRTYVCSVHASKTAICDGFFLVGQLRRSGYYLLQHTWLLIYCMNGRLGRWGDCECVARTRTPSTQNQCNIRYDAVLFLLYILRAQYRRGVAYIQPSTRQKVVVRYITILLFSCFFLCIG